MKHLVRKHTNYFVGLLELCDVQLSPAQVGTMLEHLDFVLDWNERINLTAIVEPYEAIRLHLVDSLLARLAVDACAGGELCDIGSGAGFPGVPLAIATGRPTVLVESVKKKAGVITGFLDFSGRDSLRNITVVPLRAEEYALAHSARASVVTARALSRMGSLIELASPLLAQGGSLVALKGPVTAEELQAARGVATLVGMEITGVREISLPGAGEARTFVTVTKISESRIALPRRNGLAQKNPLESPSPT